METSDAMAHKRANFTENQKAQIYVRDHATCAFSGISLWLIDNGIRSNWEMDWVDHILPSAKGGSAAISNGACASHTFNSKKGNNSSDNILFFHCGHITLQYIKSFGNPPKDLLMNLSRKGELTEADWFFNRCIANSFFALDRRYQAEIKYSPLPKCDEEYWKSAAWKRHLRFQRKQVSQSIQDRGVCNEELAHGSANLLELQSVNTQGQYHDWLEHIWPMYRASCEVFNEYENADNLVIRKYIVDTARTNSLVNRNVVDSLTALYSAEVAMRALAA